MIFSVDEQNIQTRNAMEIASFPEKFSDEITVEINADAEDHCIIILSNQVGRILRMMGVNVNQGINKIQMDNVKALESGIYQLSVKNTHSSILYTSIVTKF